MDSLNRDDVVNIEVNKSFVGAATFTVEEASVKIAKFLSDKMNMTPDFGKQWGQDGVSCRVLQANGKGWTKGKIRISLSFEPDEPIVQPGLTDAVMGGEHRTDQY